MRVRRPATVILVASLSLAPAQARAAVSDWRQETPGQEPPAATGAVEEQELSVRPAEEREARELVERFHQGFQKTHDVAPLVEDLFVRDFGARLGPSATTLPFTRIDWRDDSFRPDPRDLQSLYVATTNLWHLFFLLYDEALRKRRPEDREKEVSPAEVLPPEALELMKNDPLLRDFISPEGGQDEAQERAQGGGDAGGGGEEGGETSVGGDDDARLIKNVGQLQYFTSVDARLVEILREHLPAHPPGERKRDENSQAGNDEEAEEPDPDKVEVFQNARIIDEEFYGFPPGTRLICARAGLFHVEMVRDAEELRILSVYILIDDD